MDQGKQIFLHYLKQRFGNRVDTIMSRFEKYHEMLVTANRGINLVSRRTPPEDYWIRHYLDSILIGPLIGNSSARILDFGSGGGLPGIPLKLVFPGLEVHFLDSRRKKVSFILNVVAKIGLENCFTIVSRLEEEKNIPRDYFDYVVSRSVRLSPDSGMILLTLLKPGGKIFLYKSKNLSDADCFTDVKIRDVSHPVLGIRNIIEINKQ